MSCCPTDSTAAVSPYKSQSLPIYATGNYKSTTVILAVPDIFGLSPQSKYVADQLANATNARVLLIDFFNGNPWTADRWPRRPEHNFEEWLSAVDYETVVKPFILQLIEQLEYQGVVNIHAVGYCWGGRMCVNLQKDGLVKLIATGHPSRLNNEDDATNIKGPQCHLLSKDEADLSGIQAGLEASPFAAQSHFERFTNMPHGWMGARLDLNNPEMKQEADRGIAIFAKFLLGQL